MKRSVLLGLTVAAVFMASYVAPASIAAQRDVKDTTLTSTEMPAARLEFDSRLEYVGTQTIMLSSTTRAEQHFFVEAEGGQIKRLYWVQFEGKLEGRGRPYDYSNDPTIEVGGEIFHTNYRFYPPSGFGGRKGSDGDQARQLLEERGYRLGSDLARVRLVWLLDEPPRNELMIIYVEDLAQHELTVADLERDTATWEDFRTGLRRRAVQGLRLLVAPSP